MRDKKSPGGRRGRAPRHMRAQMGGDRVSALGLLARSWRTWLGFELLYRSCALMLVGPLLKLALDAAMALAGYTYLTWENVRAFALTPACVALVVLAVALLVLSALFEMAALHYALDLARQGRRAHLCDALRFAGRRAVGALRPRNVALVPYLLVLLPFLGMGLTAGLVRKVNLPEFVLEYVQMNPLLGVAYAGVAVGAAVVAFRWVFVPVYMVADGATFAQALRRARVAGKGHRLRDALVIVGTQLLLSVGLAVVLWALMVALTLLLHLRESVAVGASSLVYLVADLLTATPLAYAVVLARLFSRGVAETDLPEPVAGPTPSRLPHWAVPALAAGVLACSAAGGAYFVAQNFVLPAQEAGQLVARHVDLTAHRGGTFGAPENTMAAFRQAKADGADICELDVQQSKDGYIFVSHDTNFRRISGVDANAWELTYDEVLQLDATGSYWSGRVETQRYPLLDEVISWAAENDMRLNIELKPTGHETGFEKAVADIVNAHDFGGRCIVTSQAYDTVARMKEYAPEATCTYVTTLAYGDICELGAADAFSVEETSATPALVAYLHAHDKQVLCWVVNSAESMERVIGNGMDNVITDDVPLAREVIDAANEQTPLERLLTSIAAVLG